MQPLLQKIILLFFGLIPILSSAQASNEPPDISAEGDQFYCPLSEISVVSDFNIVNPDDTPINAFYIQISSGYNSSSDLLKLGVDQVNIRASWNANTAKLTLRSKTNDTLFLDDIIAAVKEVVFISSDAEFSGERFFSFTIGDANFLPSTGHFYRYFEDVGISWTKAKDDAETKVYYGLPGYLATITSSEEAQLSGEQAVGTGWIGGSDAQLEGTWKWVTGPEEGMIFWIGLANGYAPNGAFEFWNADEPNDLNGEDYAHVITNTNIGPKGSWNDLSNQGTGGIYQPQGYIVEYGYGGPEDAPNFSASTRIYTNEIDDVFGDSNCGPGQVELRATLTEIEEQPVASQIVWFDSLESATPVSTGTIYTPELTESKDFYVLASQDGCYAGQRKMVTATIYENPDIENEVTLKNCDADDIPNDGYTNFNLEEANDLINKGDLTLTIGYYLTEEDANEGLNQIDPPFFNNKLADLVIARADNLDGCFDLAIVNLTVSATNPLDVLALLETCDYDDINDGYFTFDLTDASVIILEALPQQDLIIQYYRNQEDAAVKINEIKPQTTYTNEIPFEQDLFARIESLDNGECVSVGQYVKLKIYPLPEFQVNSEEVYCTNLEPIELVVFDAQEMYTYQWKDASGALIGNGQSISVSMGGQYSVRATSVLGCESRLRVINVRESSIAIISQNDIEVIDGGEENSIRIDPTNLGIGDYEYALDNILGPYQKEPFFENLLPGNHTLYVRDLNGCGTADIQVSVIGYPKFFTPNGDGYNDTWQVQGVSVQPQSNIYIYNKFGKLLAQLDADDEGWYGLFNGNPLPSADYWYRVQLEDGRIHTGHFSLIRR